MKILIGCEAAPIIYLSAARARWCDWTGVTTRKQPCDWLPVLARCVG